jgi:hypothetical protein
MAPWLIITGFGMGDWIYNKWNESVWAEFCCHLFTLVPRSRIFLPWRWRRHVPPKSRFTQDVLGVTSQDGILHSHRCENLKSRIWIHYIAVHWVMAWRTGKDTKHSLSYALQIAVANKTQEVVNAVLKFVTMHWFTITPAAGSLSNPEKLYTKALHFGVEYRLRNCRSEPPFPSRGRHSRASPPWFSQIGC